MKERVIENTQRKYKQSSLWAGTEPKQEKRNQMLQNVVFTGILVAVFFLLIGLILPEGCFYGSTIDWYDQHVTLAETIRRTCMEEKTLAPAWMIIGGGNNGFQFAYYGYFRPDIILGCLLPQVPMTFLIPAYALCSYLAAVLLMRYWLRLEGMSPFGAFFGSMLFLLANCFFQTHRQIMFVNYLPFLLLALIFLKKRKFALMSVSLTLIYLHSFYYAIACLAVIGWFAVGMLRREADWAGKRKLLFQVVTSVILSIGMAMMLLLPTFMAILEHKHSGEKATTLTDLMLPNAQNLLYSPYGMGLTVICLYLLLDHQRISLAVSTVIAWKPVWRGTLHFKCNAVCKGKNSGSVCTGGSFVLHEDFSENPPWRGALEILDISCLCRSHCVPVGTGMVLVGDIGYRHFACGCPCGYEIEEKTRGEWMLRYRM